MAMTNRKTAYEYLLDNQCGFRKDLINEIGIDFFNEFRLIGFIKEGMNSDWEKRWEITNFGESQMRSYLNFIDVNEKLKKIKQKLEVA